MCAMKPEAVTVTEAAARLGVHRNTVRGWMKAGRLPAEKRGRCVLIPLAALATFTGRDCPQCGKPFAATDPRQRYCGDACRWAATAARRKAAHPATRGPGRPPKAAPHDPLAPVPHRLRAALAAARRA